MTLLRAGFFSLTGEVEDGYLRWHLLDHLPEQHSIPGIRLGTRWRADDACIARRWVATPDLEPVRHAVCYLLTDPVEATLHEFVALALRLREAGRMPHRGARPLLLGAFELEAAVASVVSADALPFRPHHGIALLVERGSADLRDAAAPLLEVPGVAGLLSFRATDRLGTRQEQGERFGLPAWDPGAHAVTIVYVDHDLDATCARLTPALEHRWSTTDLEPRLAMPFHRLVSVHQVGLEPTRA